MRFILQFTGLMVMLLGGICSKVCQGAIVENAQSDYQIYLSPSARETDKKAARQLQIYIYNATGGHPHITNSFTGKRQIIIGCSPEACELLKIKKEDLKTDEIVIQPVGDSLILCGEGDRGTLFAVFEYVKRELGVRFFTPREEYVPRRPKNLPLELPEKGLRHIPSVQVRNIHVNSLLQNPDFAAKLHCYGVNYTKSPEWGGTGDIVLGPWHTFDRFYPAEQHFAEHPEYFSLRDGKRVGGQFKGQLCLTNEKLRQEFLEILEEELKRNPAAQVISVSQNDNNFFCECPYCMQLAEAGESQSAPVMDFVNFMAEKLEKNHPEVHVQTFAYMYSRNPSPQIRPRSNVDILLCAIECDVSKSLDDATSRENAKFHDDLQAWSKFGNSLSLWYYVVDFNNLLQPHPNYFSFKHDIVMLSKRHPPMLMLECDAANVKPIDDLLILKTYLAAELMWDSDADIEAIEEDFINKYYGKAAGFVAKYLALREEAERKITVPVTCFSYTADWITSDFLFQCLDILEEAKEAVSDDKETFERVALLRRPFELVLISEYLKWSHSPGCPAYEEVRTTALDYLKFLNNYEVTHIGNANSVLSKKQQIERLVAFQPEPARKNAFLESHANDNMLVFEEDDFIIWGGNDYAEVVRDSLASNSWAIKWTHREPSWAVQLPIRSEFDLEAEYEIYAACRLDQKASGDMLMFGGYDSNASEQYINEHLKADALSDASYSYLPLGRHKLHASGYLFFDAKDNSQIKNSYLDHLVFIK